MLRSPWKLAVIAVVLISLLGLLAFLMLSPTKLESALESCDISKGRAQVYLDEDGEGLFLDGHGSENPGMPIKESACVLKALNLPKSIVARIDRSEDANVEYEASWDDIHLTWTNTTEGGLDLHLKLNR